MAMTIGELVTYLEHVPVKVTGKYPTEDEALRAMEVRFRVPSATGQYNQIVSPKKVSVEVLPNTSKEVIVIDTTFIH